MSRQVVSYIPMEVGRVNAQVGDLSSHARFPGILDIQPTAVGVGMRRLDTKIPCTILSYPSTRDFRNLYAICIMDLLQ